MNRTAAHRTARTAAPAAPAASWADPAWLEDDDQDLQGDEAELRRRVQLDGRVGIDCAPIALGLD
jgi:hypothetical protein